jgi:hypothetical protein
MARHLNEQLRDAVIRREMLWLVPWPATEGGELGRAEIVLTSAIIAVCAEVKATSLLIRHGSVRAAAPPQTTKPAQLGNG